MIECKVCDDGQLVKKKKFTLPLFVVFFGFLLLIPSVIGLLSYATAFVYLDLPRSSTVSPVTIDSAREMLLKEGVPEDLAEKVVNSKRVSSGTISGLPDKQKRAIESAQFIIKTSSSTRMDADETALKVAVPELLWPSAFGTLLGVLLILRKKILQCNNCGAVTAAS